MSVRNESPVNRIKDTEGNEYGKAKDIVGERSLAFTSHADAPFDVCFENQLNTKGSVMNPSRHIELDIDIGADAKDWSAIQAMEQLKPVETELRRIEEMVQEIVGEMDYLRGREQKLRDTNESTNERVKWFAFGTMGMLVGLGVWQVIYLRAYFRDVTDSMLSRARAIAHKHVELQKQLSANYDSSIAKKIGELSTTTGILHEWEKARNVSLPTLYKPLPTLIKPQSLAELHQLLTDKTTDSELRSLAAEEVETSTSTLRSLSQKLRASLVPQHPFAKLPCLIELHPGAGGDEAALFAGDLLRMYQAFCKRRRLPVSILSLESASPGHSDQIQEAILEVSAEGAYELLRGEAGVHRVQRVPATERQGRTHTSAASVLVLPSFPENAADALQGEESWNDPESDYYVQPCEVRTDVMRARGAGGQHVNTTDSAVRLTHVPTGTVVAIQESRSQHKNRQKAWQILRSRLAQARREAREEELARLRLSVVGVARMGRGDKIRT
ncbi:MAG: hypothetical protein LQ340_000930, partial [Diploschistes diacapsis]